MHLTLTFVFVYELCDSLTQLESKILLIILSLLLMYCYLQKLLNNNDLVRHFHFDLFAVEQINREICISL